MLEAVLDRSKIKTRSQAGRSFGYIEGWHAISEANRIFGFDGWTSEVVDCRCVAENQRTIGRDKNARDGWGVSYVARVRIMVAGVVREGIGAGHGIDVDLGLAHESAIKEAETDARKRALMTFGNPFGLALYDKERTGVGEAGEAHEMSTGSATATPLPVQEAARAPAPEPTPAAESKPSRPSHVIQPATRDPKAKAAEEATNRANAAQERMANSELIRKGWLADLGRYHAELKDGGRAPNLIALDFHAWEQTRLAQWSKLVPHDQAIISRAISKVQSEMVAARAKVAA